jgi:hypothetical protein
LPVDQIGTQRESKSVKFARSNQYKEKTGSFNDQKCWFESSSEHLSRFTRKKKKKTLENNIRP